MSPENIVAIVLASLSTIGALCTIIYVNVKSSFRDKQDSAITIENECTIGTDNVTLKEKIKKITSKITITLNNIEHSSTQNLVVQNSNLDANKTIKIGDSKDEESILIENNLTEETPLKSNNKGVKNIGISVGSSNKMGDFPLSIYNNSLSDLQINESREKISIKALEVFQQMIKSNVNMYQQIEDKASLIKEDDISKDRDLMGDEAFI